MKQKTKELRGIRRIILFISVYICMQLEILNCEAFLENKFDFLYTIHILCSKKKIAFLLLENDAPKIINEASILEARLY